MKSGKVLFIDDNEKILHSLKRQFLRAKFKSYFFSDLQEAYNLIKAESIDIVISDLKMSPVDGREFLKNVKKLDPKILRVLLSAHVTDSDVVKILNDHIAQDAFTKPWDKNSIVQKIENYLIIKEKYNSELVKNIDEVLGSLLNQLQVFNDLNQAIKNGENLEYIANLLKSNPLIISRIMHIANSGFFGRGKHYSLRTALSVIGIRNLKIITLSESLKNSSPKNTFSAEIKKFLDKEFQISTLIDKYYKKINDKDLPEKLSLIPMFLNIGKIFLTILFPEKKDLNKNINILTDKQYFLKENSDNNKIRHSDLSLVYAFNLNFPLFFSNIIDNHHNIETLEPEYQEIVKTYNYFDNLYHAIENNKNIKEFQRDCFSDSEFENLVDYLR